MAEETVYIREAVVAEVANPPDGNLFCTLNSRPAFLTMTVTVTVRGRRARRDDAQRFSKWEGRQR